jgi:hypothetical protein
MSAFRIIERLTRAAGSGPAAAVGDGVGLTGGKPTHCRRQSMSASRQPSLIVGPSSGRCDRFWAGMRQMLLHSKRFANSIDEPFDRLDHNLRGVTLHEMSTRQDE